MKLAIPVAALLLVFGTTAAAHARQENGQNDHQQSEHQKASPAKKQPMSSHRTTSSHQPMASHQPTSSRRTMSSHQTMQHAAPQRTVSRTEHTNTRQTRMYAHGRISDARYAASFGDQHRFHVSRIDVQHRRFVYGGYTFGFVDPWPVAWAYTDPVYVVYLDGGYYMYDPVHPGIRITLNIF